MQIKELSDFLKSAQDDDHHIALVTGASGAIGSAIARGIAAQREFAVVLVSRDEGKARQTTNEIKRVTGNPLVHYELADLSCRVSIQSLVDRWRGALHVLVNNAAVTPRTRQETPEGIELQFATNVLGYFWMTLAFSNILKGSAPARVINVSSYWAGGLDLSDLEFKRRPYTNGAAYRQSKQANRMLTVAFAERMEPFGVTVNACHPGDANSKLSNDLGFGGSESPDQAARTPVWLATGESGGSLTGRYFEHMRQVHDPFAQDKEAIEALYATCLRYSQD
jgi:NAD(P)-dependent dehydrogenase (short-subunit alcohol dehydrogenase family)